jgi:tetratricopeptide (TPR) repeat protein
VNIFLSYASEQAAIAESIEVALSADGHEVFRDRSDLPPGEAYHARIREAIAAADLFLFLVSPESVSAGRYTLTELELARDKWPNPSGRVLPVIVAPTSRGSIPGYLNGVTSLSPVGNVAASVAAAVARLGRPRWRRAVRPSVVLLALGLLAGAGFTIRWAAERSRLEREVSGLRQAAQVQADAGAYAAAWDLYAKAAALAPEDDDLARARERLAMDWVENIRVTVGAGTFAEIVDTVAPVLARCAATSETPRAADCHAHLGWSDALRAREGAGGLDPVAHYQRALKIDPDNVYAHAMWGHELLRTRGALADARAQFDAALASGREQPFVRLLQLASLLSGTHAEAENDAIRVVNDMRMKGEPVPGSSAATAPLAGRLWNVYYTRVFNGYDRESFLAAIPASDHVATFLWLFTDARLAPDRRNLRLYMLAALQEHAGARAEALANYRTLRDALARDGGLASGGRLPEGTLAALERLSKAR